MIVLDTCALLWWALSPNQLSQKARRKIDEVLTPGTLAISSISLWEIAVEVKKRKLSLGMSARDFTERVKATNLIEILHITESNWLDSVDLDWIHTDHVDRVIVATCVANRATLLTADREILEFYSDAIW